MAALQLEDLTVRASPTGARFHVTAAAARGEVVGVAVPSPPVGRAFARAIAGLVPPVAGRVVTGDRDVTAVAPPARRIGYIPAGGGLLPHLSIVDNITYRYRLDPAEQIRGLVDDEVVELTTQLELVSVQSRLPHTVTPDQRLRAAIARAVLRYPPTALVVDLPEADALALREHAVFTQVRLPSGDALAVVVCTDDAVLQSNLDRCASATTVA